jgi:AcrR family transcriptional regulator
LARPKSDDKRTAILTAATKIFADRGLGAAPTAAISKEAGIAEGTLFTYFKTKDDLVNALYREIKLDLAGAMLSDFPRTKDVRKKLRYVWDCYVNWGVAHPEQRKVLAQLSVSDILTKETRAAGSAPFAEVQATANEAIALHLFKDLPQAFIAACMQSLAETTMDFMAADSAGADRYRTLGFKLFWNGVTAEVPKRAKSRNATDGSTEAPGIGGAR